MAKIIINEIQLWALPADDDTLREAEALTRQYRAARDDEDHAVRRKMAPGLSASVKQRASKEERERKKALKQMARCSRRIRIRR